MTQSATDTVRTSIQALPADQRRDSVEDAVRSLPRAEQQAIVQTLGLGPPGNATRDILYVMVIGAFLIVVLGAAGVITGLLPSAVGITNIDKVITIFTTVLSFIVGLFVPSPGTRSQT